MMIIMIRIYIYIRNLETHPTRCIKICKIRPFPYLPICRRHLRWMSLTEPIHSACSRNHTEILHQLTHPSPMGPWGHGATPAQGVCERHVHSPDQLKVPWSYGGMSRWTRLPLYRWMVYFMENPKWNGWFFSGYPHDLGNLRIPFFWLKTRN